MELVGTAAASENAGRLLEYFRAKRRPTVHIQHISLQKDAPFFSPDTDGVLFHESIEPRPGEVVIQKHFPNSFRETGLQELLTTRGVQELVVCGMMTHMCIDATVRAAFDLGYRCRVPHDACATRNLAFNQIDIPAHHVHGAFLAALGSVYATVSSTEELLAI